MASIDDRAEERFIERLKERDESAFNELVSLHQTRVFRLVLRMLGRHSEAEDMAQEVFVHVFKSIGEFRGEAKLSTWIYRIAVNLCKNRGKYLARRKQEKTDDADSKVNAATVGFGSADVGRPDQMAEGHQAERIIHDCLQELDADFREVLVLRDVEDMTYEEVCQVTGLAEGTVKSRLHRARTALKAMLQARLGDKVR